MTNKIAIFQYLKNLYNEVSFTHNYIYGFTYHGMVYMVITDSKIMDAVLVLDKASRGAGYSLRFKPSNKIKEYMMTLAPIAICTADFFKGAVEASRYNKGEVFEKLVTEYYGMVWEKDSVPFTDAGDIEVDGVAYQIKFEGATFTNERLIKSLIGEA